MTGGFPREPLGTLAQNLDARRVPLSGREREKRRGRYPYHGATGVMDYIDGFLFEGLHLLVAEDGSVETTDGKPFLQLVDGRFWVNNHAHVLKGETDEDTRFLYYALSTVAIRPFMSGSVQAKLSQGNMNRIPIPYPRSKSTRDAITRVLGALDDKIESNRKMNETIEEMARALFQSWFVDFDPVRAKAEGRRPEGMDDETAALFSDSFEDSEIGEVPRGWRIGPILDQAELLSGGTPKTAVVEYWSGLIPWASAKDVSQCGECFLVATERSITERGLEESATQLIPAFSTVIVARGATTGRMTMFGLPMAMNQTCYALWSKGDIPFALYCRIRDLIGGVVHAGHGSVFNTITTSTFSAARCVLPPEALLFAFEKIASPLFLRILSNLHEIRTLAALRDALLPRLLSGGIRAEDTGVEAACYE